MSQTFAYGCANPPKLGCFLDPSAAPAFGCNLLASKQRAWASCFFRLTCVQLAIGAVLLVGVLGILFSVDLGRVRSVAKPSGCWVFFVDHGWRLCESVSSSQNGCARSSLDEKYAAGGVVGWVVHRGLSLVKNIILPQKNTDWYF